MISFKLRRGVDLKENTKCPEFNPIEALVLVALLTFRLTEQGTLL